MAEIFIGNDVLGTGSAYFPPINNKAVCRFQNTSAYSVTLSKAYGYWGYNYPSAKVKVVIYSDTSSLPDALLATSNELVGIANGLYVNEFTFPTPLVVAAGAYVWIGAISDTQCLAIALAGGVIKYNANSYASGPSGTFGTPTSAAYTYSIFCTGDDGEMTLGRASVNTGAGIYAGIYYADAEHLDKFILGGTSSILVASISTYIKTTSATAKCKAAIYTDVAGVPTALVGQTSEVTGTTANSWLVLTFPIPPTLAPGTYWLAFISDTDLDTPLIPASGHLQNNGTIVESTAWPSTMVALTYDNAPKGLDIYASYSIVVPSNRPVVFVCM